MRKDGYREKASNRATQRESKAAVDEKFATSSLRTREDELALRGLPNASEGVTTTTGSCRETRIRIAELRRSV